MNRKFSSLCVKSKFNSILSIFRSESLKAAESFLAILQEALSDQIFIIDYQRLHPVVNDIEILQQACPELYPFQRILMSFILKIFDIVNIEV